MLTASHTKSVIVNHSQQKSYLEVTIMQTYLDAHYVTSRLWGKTMSRYRNRMRANFYAPALSDVMGLMTTLSEPSSESSLASASKPSFAVVALTDSADRLDDLLMLEVKPFLRDGCEESLLNASTGALAKIFHRISELSMRG